MLVGLLLVGFFGATIFVLDSAFRQAGEQAERDLLDTHLIALLAAAEPTAGHRLRMPAELPEPRFAAPGSGLYGVLRDADGRVIWRSFSTLGLELDYDPPPPVGERRFTRLTLADGARLMALDMSVAWEFADGVVVPFQFRVARSLESFHAQLDAFRRRLFGWFALLVVAMVVVLGLSMRRLLRPLARIEREIADVETGRRSQLSSGYPAELAGAAENLNRLIVSERQRSERYRRTLGDLAHSLKTPLAATRTLLDERIEPGVRQKLSAQLERMGEIVRYQLRKPAAGAGASLGAEPVPVAKDIGLLVEGLEKVHRDKAPRCEIEIGAAVLFHGDRGDLLELAGNLLDNACKWCESRVRIAAAPLAGPGRRPGLEITVDDDGAGFPDSAAAARALERGVRLDERGGGQGIGLAVVADIAASYGGEIAVSRSPLGGARVRVTLPGA